MFNKTLFQMRKDDGIGKTWQENLAGKPNIGKTWKDRP
jgi:hypothetical protein